MTSLHILPFFCFLHLSIWAQQKRAINLLDFGAVPDGKTMNTHIIQRAIDQCAENGGGQVVFPKGKYLTGTLSLKSDVELHFTEGSILLGSTVLADYRRGDWYALILARDQKNIAITGKGTIDGQGNLVIQDVIRLWTAKEFPDDFPDSTKVKKEEIRPKESNRPEIIEFFNCENIRIEGVSIKNAASWVQTYANCRNLLIDKIRVESMSYWNNDGIDIVDGKDVEIRNCFVNAADDAICLKSNDPKLGCENVLIENCTLRSSASALKMGTASYGGFRKIRARKLKIFDTYRSAIAIECVDGGITEDIEIEDVDAKNTGNALFMRIGHRNKDARQSILQNICIRNLKADIPNGKPDTAYAVAGPPDLEKYNLLPASIVGLPDAKIKNVILDRLTITYGGGTDTAIAFRPLDSLAVVPERADKYPEFTMFGELPAWAFYVRHTEGVIFKNIKVRLKQKDYRPAIVFDDSQKIELDKVQISIGGCSPKIHFFNSVVDKIIKCQID